jgi:hypothetical protein
MPEVLSLTVEKRRGFSGASVIRLGSIQRGLRVRRDSLVTAARAYQHPLDID